jgi:eukaryotic-like serine/threonine-protein kinase
LQETVLNGRYRLGEVLGEGGMAVVYRSHDLLLNRPVAIKILRAQYAADESFLRRFEREAQAAAGFSHPNIVNVYDVGTDGDQHYIVMEYIRGPSLKDLIRRQGPFSVDGAIFIIGQVASALDYAHQRGLVHRDIKPQNILVDREGNAKVVDFGIAKGMRDVNLTEAGTGMGTVHYVSPEQARGDPAGPASDLYSTGIVLFEMLTKRLPFEADTPVGVAMQHVNASPPLPSSFNPSIPAPVDTIVLKALAKNPEERYASGAQLATALRHWDMPTLMQPAIQPRPEPAPRAEMRERPPAPRAQRPGEATQVMPPHPRGTPGAPGAPRPAGARPRGAMPPPPRGGTRARGGYAPLPQARTNRDDLGCATWLIGSAILLGIIGLIVVAFRLGPGAFSAEAPTPTVAVVAEETPTPTVMPTPQPDEPTPTEEPSPTPEPTPTEVVLVVPSLVGGTVDGARGAIGDLTLVVEEEFSPSPAGVIISQSPGAGASLSPGDTVTVVVSLGPEFTAVPDVRGLATDVARQRLENLGFSVRIVEENDPDFEEDTVIRTEPVGQARSGSTVTMYVSLGEVAIVPYIYGMEWDDALEELARAGLTVGNVTAMSCTRILAETPNFDCDDFRDGGVVFSTLLWNATVPNGARIDIAYFDDDE